MCVLVITVAFRASVVESGAARRERLGVHLDRTASQTGQPSLCSCQSDSPSEVHLKGGAAAH